MNTLCLLGPGRTFPVVNRFVPCAETPRRNSETRALTDSEFAQLLSPVPSDVFGGRGRARSASDAGVLRRKGRLKEQDQLIDFIVKMHETHTCEEAMVKMERLVQVRWQAGLRISGFQSAMCCLFFSMDIPNEQSCESVIVWVNSQNVRPRWVGGEVPRGLCGLELADRVNALHGPRAELCRVVACTPIWGALWHFIVSSHRLGVASQGDCEVRDLDLQQMGAKSHQLLPPCHSIPSAPSPPQHVPSRRFACI
jgi:hypothetical protein